MNSPVNLYSRQFIMAMVREVARISGQQIEMPKCVQCGFFDQGHCVKWGQTVPIEAWRDGCHAFEEWVPF